MQSTTCTAAYLGRPRSPLRRLCQPSKGGWRPAAELVMRLLGERITEAAAWPGGQDFKTRLQELAARQYDQLPRYEVRDEGPDHAKVFSAVVYVDQLARGEGQGRSKKQAEQAAAREAWLALQTEHAQHA